MNLAEIKRVYEKLGREDPMYAVLTRKGYQHNRWDPNEFFRTGEEEIARIMEYVESLGRPTARGRALDFGCGVGRLTRALADHFQEVVGIDIAESMIEAAQSYNRHGDRVRHLVNAREDLRVLQDDSFDLVYSNITLQHIPPPQAEAYIGEFIRVLRPGGLAIFQVRDGPRIRPGSLRARLYTLRRRHLRRLWKRVRGLPAFEMHYVARSRVEEIVEERGGRMLDVVDVSADGAGGSLRYCAVKPARRPADARAGTHP